MLHVYVTIQFITLSFGITIFKSHSPVLSIWSSIFWVSFCNISLTLRNFIERLFFQWIYLHDWFPINTCSGLHIHNTYLPGYRIYQDKYSQFFPKAVNLVVQYHLSTILAHQLLHLGNHSFHTSCECAATPVICFCFT